MRDLGGHDGDRTGTRAAALVADDDLDLAVEDDDHLLRAVGVSAQPHAAGQLEEDGRRAARAGTSHWIELHPPPDVEAWAAIADPGERLGVAVGELYGYYRETQAMWTTAYRDAALVESLSRSTFPPGGP